ncbi:MAG: glycoside hydrolase family 92 protein [Butyrivibrio sp.]|nr:glycoside hydrolase family 92 protein [Butyrivibrio sp.]
MLGSGNVLDIINETVDNSAFSVSFNGTDITENFIAYDKLMQGGTLRFYTEA